MMKLIVLVVVLFFGFSTAPETTTAYVRVRYANSMPQFGSARVVAKDSNSTDTTIFSSVGGGFVTYYTNYLPQGKAIFSSFYATNVSAHSADTQLSSEYFSVYTHQTHNRALANTVLQDKSVSDDPTKASLRAINLVQYDYPITIYNDTSNTTQHTLFSSLNYASSSGYHLVDEGEYAFSWSTSGKRQGGENGSYVRIRRGSAYTLWVLASGSAVTTDGTTTSKREVSAPAINQIRSRRIAMRQSLSF